MASGKLVITISGPHGVGKSTYAKALSKSFGLRHVSAGTLFRKMARDRGMSLMELTNYADKQPDVDRLIDSRTEDEAKVGSVVLDGVLTGWIAKNADLKVFLEAPQEARIRRIAKRDGLTYAEAKKITLIREEVERKRFLRYYGIDPRDESIYDIIIDTHILPIESTIAVLEEITRTLIAEGARRNQ